MLRRVTAGQRRMTAYHPGQGGAVRGQIVEHVAGVLRVELPGAVADDAGRRRQFPFHGSGADHGGVFGEHGRILERASGVHDRRRAGFPQHAYAVRRGEKIAAGNHGNRKRLGQLGHGLMPGRAGKSALRGGDAA